MYADKGFGQTSEHLLLIVPLLRIVLGSFLSKLCFSLSYLVSPNRCIGATE
jgi:hypothetical protein